MVCTRRACTFGLVDELGRLKEDVIDFLRELRVKLPGHVKARAALAILASFGPICGEGKTPAQLKAFDFLDEITRDEAETDWARVTAQIVLAKVGRNVADASIVDDATAKVVREILNNKSQSDKAKFQLVGDLAPLQWPYLARHLLPKALDASGESEHNRDYTPAKNVDVALPSPSQRARLRKAIPVKVAPIAVPPPGLPATPVISRSATPPAPSLACTPGGSVDTAALFNGGNKLTAESKAVVEAYLSGDDNPESGEGSEVRVSVFRSTISYFQI